MIKKCGACGAALVGRADKKFCSDICRNFFHNRKNRNELRLFEATNRVLKKNRQILFAFQKRKAVMLEKKELLKRGFRFDYFTGRSRSRSGTDRYYCYDMGYELRYAGILKIIRKYRKAPARHSSSSFSKPGGFHGS
jgi:predicted nucleic acid-binding Zn ribbon protein